MVESRNNQRSDSNTAQKSPSVNGDQPRSLNVNWMKYDVTDENIDLRSVSTQSSKLSPLR